MITHDQRWSLPRGNTLVPSGWRATARLEVIPHGQCRCPTGSERSLESMCLRPGPTPIAERERQAREDRLGGSRPLGLGSEGRPGQIFLYGVRSCHYDRLY
jgi:hypothetical protein